MGELENPSYKLWQNTRQLTYETIERPDTRDTYPADRASRADRDLDIVDPGFHSFPSPPRPILFLGAGARKRVSLCDLYRQSLVRYVLL